MKDVFCANEQTITPHKASLSPDGEFVFTCETEDCGRFIKFPADADNLAELLTVHEEANVGQVSLEKQEQKLAEFLDSDKKDEKKK